MGSQGTTSEGHTSTHQRSLYLHAQGLLRKAQVPFQEQSLCYQSQSTVTSSCQQPEDQIKPIHHWQGED